MGKIVIVYGSTDGQTAKIASRIADTLRAAGREVEMADVRGAAPSLTGAAAVLVGGSLRFGHYQREIEAFARKNRVALDAVPNVFFAVSISAARSSPRSQAEVQKSIDRFVQTTGWTPQQRATFAGAITWTRYGLGTKLMLLLLLKMLKATETDTSRDYELTDWAAVKRFAEELAASLRGKSAA
ncbi:MAG: flavodoxin domain-containing protein [Myxococcales bacterium]